MFNGKSEAEVVAEGAVKNSYEQTVDSVVAKRFKVQTTTRVTSELQWADEDNQLQIIRSIQADQAAALGRALDYVIYHAINPKTGTALSGFNPLSTSAVQVIAGDDEISNVERPGRCAERLLRHQRRGIVQDLGVPSAQAASPLHRPCASIRRFR